MTQVAPCRGRPGPTHRYEGRDLAVTADFRDLFSEVVSAHLGARALDRIFPDRPADTSRFPGAFKA
jgi:uncharacterized protein (DUF1501 family)